MKSESVFMCMSRQAFLATAAMTAAFCFGGESEKSEVTRKECSVVKAQNRKAKIVPSVRTDIPGYSKVIVYSTETGGPAVGGGWGHECRFSVPNEKGVYEVEMYGLDGKPQHPAGHSGFCLPFVCRDHFDKKASLPIRLTADPVVIYVGGAAKIGVYGQLQRVYDSAGNELVLNRNPGGGYILFLVSPEKKVLSKYYLENGNALKNGSDGYAYATYSYSREGELVETKKFDVDGKPVE